MKEACRVKEAFGVKEAFAMTQGCGVDAIFGVKKHVWFSVPGDVQNYGFTPESPPVRP